MTTTPAKAAPSAAPGLASSSSAPPLSYASSSAKVATPRPAKTGKVSPAKALANTTSRSQTQTKRSATKTTPPQAVVQKRAAQKQSARPHAAAPKATKASPIKAAPVKAAPAKAQSAAAAPSKGKAAKEKKVKVVRDSFTIPKTEFNQIGDTKTRAMKMEVDVKKSEIIRAGLMLLQGLSDANFKKALAAVPTIKTGRPSKG